MRVCTASAKAPRTTFAPGGAAYSVRHVQHTLKKSPRPKRRQSTLTAMRPVPQVGQKMRKRARWLTRDPARRARAAGSRSSWASAWGLPCARARACWPSGHSGTPGLSPLASRALRHRRLLGLSRALRGRYGAVLGCETWHGPCQMHSKHSPAGCAWGQSGVVAPLRAVAVAPLPRRCSAPATAPVHPSHST
jgi:hypothetical protein